MSKTLKVRTIDTIEKTFLSSDIADSAKMVMSVDGDTGTATVDQLKQIFSTSGSSGGSGGQGGGEQSNNTANVLFIKTSEYASEKTLKFSVDTTNKSYKTEILQNKNDVPMEVYAHISQFIKTSSGVIDDGESYIAIQAYLRDGVTENSRTWVNICEYPLYGLTTDGKNFVLDTHISLDTNISIRGYINSTKRDIVVDNSLGIMRVTQTMDQKFQSANDIDETVFLYAGYNRTGEFTQTFKPKQYGDKTYAYNLKLYVGGTSTTTANLVTCYASVPSFIQRQIGKNITFTQNTKKDDEFISNLAFSNSEEATITLKLVNASKKDIYIKIKYISEYNSNINNNGFISQASILSNTFDDKCSMYMNITSGAFSIGDNLINTDGTDVHYAYSQDNTSAYRWTGYGDTTINSDYPTDIYIQDRVASIVNRSFSDKTKVQKLRPNKNLVAIKQNAFKADTALNELNLSCATNLRYIENNAFQGCTGLTQVDFINCSSLTSIGNYAFGNVPITNEINLLNTKIETIGGNAFNNNKSIAIKIPHTTNSIGTNAFTPNTNITGRKIYLPTKSDITFTYNSFATSDTTGKIEQLWFCLSGEHDTYYEGTQVKRETVENECDKLFQVIKKTTSYGVYGIKTCIAYICDKNLNPIKTSDGLQYQSNGPLYSNNKWSFNTFNAIAK